MSVVEFREFLLQLAVLYDDAAKADTAAGLRRLAELFDGDQNQRLASYLAKIERARAAYTAS